MWTSNVRIMTPQCRSIQNSSIKPSLPHFLGNSWSRHYWQIATQSVKFYIMHKACQLSHISHQQEDFQLTCPLKSNCHLLIVEFTGKQRQSKFTSSNHSLWITLLVTARMQYSTVLCPTLSCLTVSIYLRSTCSMPHTLPTVLTMQC